MADFDEAIGFVFRDEGGLVDDPADPGGITQYGISLRFYKEIKAEATENDIKNLTPSMAIAIYRSQFWDKYKYGLITDQHLANKVMDLAVNMGPKEANICLQRAVNNITASKEGVSTYLQPDGILGKQSLFWINDLKPISLLEEYKKVVKTYYLGLVAEKPKLKKFLDGWIHRDEEET